MLIGLVGKPSAGKSTFFKSATLAEVEIASYPFTTIKANSGASFVRISCVDKEFNKQCNPREGYCLENNRFIPVQLMDVAGLVPGAHEGKGMGNKFLDDLRQADVLIHILDISGSTNERGELINKGEYDPINDVKFLENELDMWYLSILKKGWEKFARQIQQEHLEIDKTLAKQLSGLKVTEEMVKDSIKNLSKNTLEWTENDLKELATKLRKLSKPMIIAANKIDISGTEKNLEKIKKEFQDYVIIPCSADSELALREAAKSGLIKYIPGDNNFKIIKEPNEKQKKALEFIRENVLKKYGKTGVQEILNKAVFDLLKYIAIYPGGVNKLEDSEGNVLPDCFLMKSGSTALDFAFRLHTDFGKNFIKAINVKTKQVIGKDYVLKHKDVIEIMLKR